MCVEKVESCILCGSAGRVLHENLSDRQFGVPNPRGVLPDVVTSKVSSSFRDPSGFLFYRAGILYRQVNTSYKDHYDRLMRSGLYEELIDLGLLIPHEEDAAKPAQPDKAYKVIKPEWVPFISYPYEWCFSQLRDAALTTLKVQKIALQHGMSLKDCSAYNIQFREGRPIFVDTLSFERYVNGQPWVAYRQFCQHFLAPLALMSFKDIRLGQLFRIHLDGIPLDLTSSLLPLRSRFAFSLLTHIHLHAKSQAYFAASSVRPSFHTIGRMAFLALIESLESAVRKLKWQPPHGTVWTAYYDHTNYSSNAFHHKQRLVAEYLEKCTPRVVWDLGANTGLFSRLASNRGVQTISFDYDPAAVEENYLACVKAQERNILPLLLDLVNPSSAIGWAHAERMSLLERGPADVVLALALIHHLAISNNLPLAKIAEFLSKVSCSLIIEFVSKSDSQFKRLLSTREDIFSDYTQTTFEREFGTHFTIENSARITGSERIIYLMHRRTV